MKKSAALILAGVLVAIALYGTFQLLVPLPVADNTAEIEIPKGTTFRQAAEIFSRARVIREKNLFVFIGRITGIDRKIRAGFYAVDNTMNLLDLLRALKIGQIVEYDITVIEGDSLREIAAKFAERNIIQEGEFRKLVSDRDFLAAYRIDAPSVEGFLYPDTYKIPKGMEPRDAVGMMIDTMRQHFSEDLRARALEIGMSETEVLTLASIIEKEAAADEERPLISAVYHNRLKKKMLLQADPTAIYGIKSSREKITLEDLKKRTPYNTYTTEGLPPGPIASAGIKSITAALYPADVPYLFFVSNNDGTHHFSATAAEHEAAVKAYREKKQAADMQRKTEDSQENSKGHDTS